MVQEFDYAKDQESSERQFQAWRKEHPKGFVVNRDGQNMLLHFADCWHFHGETIGINNTKKPKVCATDRAELELWASKNGVGNLVGCQTCKLD